MTTFSVWDFGDGDLSDAVQVDDASPMLAADLLREAADRIREERSQ